MSSWKSFRKTGAILMQLYEVQHGNVYELPLKVRRPGLLTKDVLLGHDNACRHTAASIRGLLQCFRRRNIYHPQYSPDLEWSNFFTFSKLIRNILAAIDFRVARMWKHRRTRLFFIWGAIIYHKGVEDILLTPGQMPDLWTYFQCCQMAKKKF